MTRAEDESIDVSHNDLLRQRRPYSSGALYLLGQSIGDWDDVSPRCLRIIQEADLVAAEDTRKLNHLLRHFGIAAKKVESYHDFSSPALRERLVKMMVAGGTVALISDAGMPAIADPGYKLIVAVLQHNLPVVPVPGASAAVTAVMASGLPTDSFSFLGFLPRTSCARRKKLELLKSRTETLVFYESNHRICASIQDALEVLGDRDACVAREMTKEREEFLRGRLSDISAEMRARVSIRGEITLVIAGCHEPTHDMEAIREEILEMIAQGLHTKLIRDRVSDKWDIPKRVVYQMVHEIRPDATSASPVI